MVNWAITEKKRLLRAAINMFGTQFPLEIIQSKTKQSSVFVVSDSNSDDVSASLQLSSNGEKARLTIKDGYHIELSMYAQILLMPEQ